MFKADTDTFLDAFEALNQDNYIKVVHSYHKGKKFFKVTNYKIGAILPRKQIIINARSAFETVKLRFFRQNCLEQLEKGIKTLLTSIHFEKSFISSIFGIKTLEEKKLLLFLDEILDYSESHRKEKKKIQPSMIKLRCKKVSYQKVIRRNARKCLLDEQSKGSMEKINISKSKIQSIVKRAKSAGSKIIPLDIKA